MHKNNETDILGLKYTRSEIINSKSEFNRLDLARDRVIKLEEASLEHIYIDGKNYGKIRDPGDKWAQRIRSATLEMTYFIH